MMPSSCSDVVAAAGTASCVAGSQKRGGAFTLVELLTVIAIITVLLALIVPAVTKVNSGRQMTLAAYNVDGLLETARAYAKANNTYTWVGFYEEDGSQFSPNSNPHDNSVGRVIVSAVASTDGTALGTAPLDSVPSKLTQINKLVKLDNTHLTITSQDVPKRTTVPPAAYQVGSPSFLQSTSPKTTFNYPLGAAAPTYKFEKIIQFNPAGDAIKILDSPVPLMEIGLCPARGAVADTTVADCIDIQITGINGAVHIYQP